MAKCDIDLIIDPQYRLSKLKKVSMKFREYLLEEYPDMLVEDVELLIKMLKMELEYLCRM